MKKKITILLIILFNIKVYTQTYSNIVSDSLINKLLILDIDNRPKIYDDQRIWKKRINDKPIPWSEAMILIISPETSDFNFQKKALIRKDKRQSNKLKKLTEIFSKTDFDFMEKQFNSERKNKWNFKTKKGRLKRNPKRKFYSYTVPLFNENLTKAILYSEFGGGCKYCDEARVLIYIKKRETWKLYKTISLWRS